MIRLPPMPMRLLTCLAALALPQAAHAQSPVAAPPGCTGPTSDTWISIVADGLKSGDGQLAITLYPDISKRFLVKHGSLYVGRVPATQGTTAGCIFLPKPGVYVIALYHDENGNEKYDRNSFGIPTEGYGFSNNPSTLMGLPAFSSVRLDVRRSGMLTRIHMRYP